MAPADLPPSAVALADLLEKEPGVFKATGIHRTALWKFKTGKRKPDSVSAAILEEVSGGRVPASGWATPAEIEERKTKTPNAAA